MRTPIIPHSLKNAKWIAAASLLAVVAFFGLRAVWFAPEKNVSLFRYLSEHSIESVTLELDMGAVFEKDSSDLPAVLKWRDENGETVSLPLEISVRGNDRREVCSFPPLKLEPIASKELGITGKDIKLVSHCVEGTGEMLLLREYLAYQLYAALTEASFKTHLVRITYADSREEAGIEEAWAFLLEPKDDLQDRLDADDWKEGEPLKTISAYDYNRFAVFQFMIGNTDWNLEKEHNLKMMVSKKEGLPFPVPYDFDRSGLVNAPYAIPHSMLPINTVQDRYFQWRGKDRSQLTPILDEFRAKHDELIGLCRDLDILPDMERQSVVEYLEEFFQNIDILLGDGRQIAHTTLQKS
ncbi:MAG: hypothetical protein H6563_12775 [Lewinellaceae bacterium]|nr:hypothetical protein [Lewinellaceae bacterium]